MKSFFAGLSGKKGKFTLVATVDEHSLVFLLFRNTPNGLEFVRHGVQKSSSLPGTFLLDELISQLRDGFSVQELIVSFAAPYFEIQSAIQSIQRTNKKGEITRGEVRSIKNKMVEEAERLVRKRIFEDSGILPDDFVVQNIQTSRWKIDGYTVEQLEGFKGKEVEGLVLGTFLRQDYARFIRKLKKKHRIPKVSLVHPFQGAQRIKKLGVFVYITEEKTQLFLINKDAFALTESFSPGGNRFRDVFQEEFGMIENIAEEFEDKYVQGTLSEEVRERIHSVLLPEVYNFGTLVGEKLGSVKISTTPNVFMFGVGIRFKEILQMLASGVTKNIPFQDKANVQVLTPKHVQGKFALPQDLDTRYTPVLFMTEVLYAKETH